MQQRFHAMQFAVPVPLPRLWRAANLGVAIRLAIRLAIGLAILLGAAGTAHAQIVIGQTADLSGSAALAVKEITQGAKLLFDSINAKGGIAGQKIELRSLDDKFDGKQAVANVKELAADPKVVALFLTRGTAPTLAVMPALNELKLPLIGPSTGALALHQPVHPYVFNVRATYQREAEHAVRHLATVGMSKIAVVQVDDSFGSDAAAGALRGFDEVKIKPAVLVKYDRVKPDYASLAKSVAGVESQAILFIGPPGQVVEGTKALRKAGTKAQIVTLSNNAASGFIKQMGENGPGTIVAQVFPSERSLSNPMIKELTGLAKGEGINELSPAMVEGFAAAKVLVEGLRRAGAAPTREKLLAALNGLKKVDIGGMEISYSSENHTGLEFVDLSLISPSGKFMR